MISERLLGVICCPVCKGELELSADNLWLICKNCGLMYPVKDDIPVLIPEEARKIDEKKGD